MYTIGRNLLLVFVWVSMGIETLAQQTVPHPFPYALSWKTDGPLGGGAGLILITGYAIPRAKPVYSAQDFASLDPANVNAFDRRATRYYSESDDRLRTWMLAGTAVTGAISLPVLIYEKGGEKGGSPFLHQCVVVGTMYAEGLALNAGAVEWCKKFVDRPRPYAYNPTLTYAQKSSQDYLSSFYSNSTALQWYTAGFIARVVNDLCPGSPARYFVWVAAGVYSGVQGYLGVRSGQHFPTDVLTGAIFGGLSGILIPAAHITRNHRNFSVIPEVGIAGTPQLCFRAGI